MRREDTGTPVPPQRGIDHTAARADGAWNRFRRRSPIVVTSALHPRTRRPRDHRVRHRRGRRPGDARHGRVGVEQRSRRTSAGAGHAASGRPMRALREETGLATVETTLMVVILVPLIFGVIEFGSLFQRWLAAESVAVHAARYAGELGGDQPALRDYIARELRDVGIDPSRVI